METLKRQIYKRIAFKYIMMFLLAAFTLCLVIGAILEQAWAVIGYLGMILIIILMMIFPRHSIFNEKLSVKNYQSILEYFSKSNEIRPIWFIEAIYILAPEIDRLLYQDDKTILYFTQNIRILQPLLKHHRDFVLEHQKTFAQVSQELLQNLENKCVPPNMYDMQYFEKIPREVVHYKKYLVSPRLFKCFPAVLAVAYLIFKLVVTFGYYECIGGVLWIKVAYNVGADIIVVLTVIIQRMEKLYYDTWGSNIEI